VATARRTAKILQLTGSRNYVTVKRGMSELDDTRRCYIHAQMLARAGFKIFPVTVRGKKPVFKGWQAAATSDLATVEKWWWGKFAGCNIGIITDGLIVVDVDPRNKGDSSLKKLTAKYGPLPPTTTVRTGGGGWHYIYRA